MSEWKPIETAKPYVEVLVTGPSGYTNHRRFIINAYRDPEYRSGWLDATNTSLSEAGWEPTHWMPPL